MKREIFVRFANEGNYYSKITINPKKIKNPIIFTDEVFFDIDNIRVAVKKEDWNEMMEEHNNNNNNNKKDANTNF
jgi:hypothetical protein